MEKANATKGFVVKMGYRSDDECYCIAYSTLREDDGKIRFFEERGVAETAGNAATGAQSGYLKYAVKEAILVDGMVYEDSEQ